MRPSRLALGTVQFGLPYGVANQTGQISEAEARAILLEARAQGLDTLDTAIAYGTSEQRLGRIGVSGWKIITKLPDLPAGLADTAGWLQDQIMDSMNRLGVDFVHGLLLHRPGDLLGPQGHDLFNGLQRLKAQGRVNKIGVSIYDPDELPELLGRGDIDLVQAPLNIFDRRLSNSGWLERLCNRGIEVHIRSVFLQGLLLMPINDRPHKFNRWQPLWRRWHTWLMETGHTPLQACLGFALAQPGIARVIVGVDGLTQLREILAAAESPGCLPPNDLSSDDLDLINPSRWQLIQ